MQGYLNNFLNKKTFWMIAYHKWIRTYYMGKGPVSKGFSTDLVPFFFLFRFIFTPDLFKNQWVSCKAQPKNHKSWTIIAFLVLWLWLVSTSDVVLNFINFFSYRKFKIRVRREIGLFTDDFKAENSLFDPAQVVTGNVEGTVLTLQLRILSIIKNWTRYIGFLAFWLAERS